MGCGASTFNRDETGGAGGGGAGGPAYLYINPLHRDFPWRRRGDPSSKQLLDDPRVDEDGDSLVRKSVSLTPLLPKANVSKKVPLVQMMKEIPHTKDVREERSIGGDPECDNRRSNAGDNRCDTDEASDREDSIFYPGSPSFRDYCTSRYDDEDEDDSDDTSAPINEGKSDSALTMGDSHKSRKDQNCGNADPPKLLRSQTSSSSRKSRRSPKRRLRAVLPKRNRMSGMKNLLHGS